MSLSLAGNGTVTGFDASASGFGGLVAVKHALFTGTHTASVNGGNNTAVTDLSITHEVADPSNKLLISASVGMVYSSNGTAGQAIGMAIHDGTSLINIGNAAGDRIRISTGQRFDLNDTKFWTNFNFNAVYTPGSGSKTYTVRIINITTATYTIYVNRNPRDLDTEFDARGASSLVIQEVAV